MTTACGGQAATPTAASVATSRPAVSPTTPADPSSTISPAPLPGGRLVYGSEIEDRGSLFTINPDAGSPTWTSDGKILFYSQRKMWLMDADGPNAAPAYPDSPTLWGQETGWSYYGYRQPIHEPHALRTAHSRGHQHASTTSCDIPCGLCAISLFGSGRADFSPAIAGAGAISHAAILSPAGHLYPACRDPLCGAMAGWSPGVRAFRFARVHAVHVEHRWHR